MGCFFHRSNRSLTSSETAVEAQEQREQSQVTPVCDTQVSTNKAEPSVVGTAPHPYLPIFPSNSPLSPVPIPKLAYCNGVSVAGLKKCAAARFTLQGHTDQFMSVAFSPDGKRIVSAPDGKSVRVWDAERGVQIGILEISWSASNSFCNLSQQYSRQ